MKEIPTVKEINESSKTNRRGYERFLDYLANYVVKAALIFHISPMQLTFLWVIGQFCVLLLFLKASYVYFVIAILLFQLLFIVDMADGKLFRFYSNTEKKNKPLFPKYLDRLGHFINNPLLFVFLGSGTYLRFHEIIYMYVGFIAATFFMLNKAISVNPTWYKSLEERETIVKIISSTLPRKENSPLRVLLFDVIRIEHLGNILCIGIILDMSQYVLFFYAGIQILEFIRKLLSQGILLWKTDQL